MTATINPDDDHFKRVANTAPLTQQNALQKPEYPKCDPAKWKTDPKYREEWRLELYRYEKHEAVYGARIPKKYLRFTTRFRPFWVKLNLFMILVSVGMMVGSVLISKQGDSDSSKDAYRPPQCAGLDVVNWALFALHVVNAIFCSMTLCNLEKKVCTQMGLIVLLLFDVVMLVWAQITYFNSQRYNCTIETPGAYFWTMGEILFFYVLTVMVICYFFRKLCQDPNLEKEEEREDDQLRKAQHAQNQLA